MRPTPLAREGVIPPARGLRVIASEAARALGHGRAASRGAAVRTSKFQEG